MEYSKHSFVRAVQKIDSFFNYISKICYWIAAALIVGVTVMIFASVINRTFIGGVWLFVEEYATLALIPMSYFVYGYVLRQNRHLNLDIIYNKFPFKGRIILSIFSGLFTLIVCFFMVSEAWNYMMYQLEANVVSSGVMKTPLWIFSLFILISVILFAIDLVFFIMNRIILWLYDEQPLKFIGRIEENADENINDAELMHALELQAEEKKGGDR